MSNFQMNAPKNAFPKFKKKHFDKVALIDADKMKHLVAYDVACDLKQNMPRDEHRLRYHIEQRIAEVFNQFSARGYIFCFSGKSNNTFRAHIAFDKEYKGSRKEDPSFYEGKIEDMAEVVKSVMSQHPTLLFNELEADDILCFLQCEDTFIYSNDKDLKQIPGFHFDFGIRDIYEIDETQAFKNLMYQLLIGDSTDCISGLKGCGPKKAEKIMSEVTLKQLPNRILLEYQKAYGLTNGIDAYTEAWMLVKLRPKRGDHFLNKFKEAQNLLDIIILNSK